MRRVQREICCYRWPLAAALAEQNRGSRQLATQRDMAKSDDALQGYACSYHYSLSLSRKPPLEFQVPRGMSAAIVHDSNRNGPGAGVGDDESCPAQTWSTLAAGKAFTYRASYSAYLLLNHTNLQRPPLVQVCNCTPALVPCPPFLFLLRQRLL